MRRYLITCPKCELTREVGSGQYSTIMNGKSSAYCIKCRSRNELFKEYKITCPICLEERIVNRNIYHKWNRGKTKGLCEKCHINYIKFGDRQEIITPQTIANEAYLKIYKEQNAISQATYQSKHRDILNEKSREYRRNNIDRKRFIGRIAQFKRRAFSHISKNIIEQIIEEHTINGMIFCYICRTECSDNYHIDHVIPIIKGGRNNKENLKIACSFCNQSKGAKDLEEFLDKNPYLKALYLKEEA